mmetsp:Transcript_30046/g.73195  ORF Transcript_30046/g.73195 Transcript_30046/m.73195 type:complete len:226 (+) Transcript_30046:483-1160(+)
MALVISLNPNALHLLLLRRRHLGLLCVMLAGLGGVAGGVLDPLGLFLDLDVHACVVEVAVLLRLAKSGIITRVVAQLAISAKVNCPRRNGVEKSLVVRDDDEGLLGGQHLLLQVARQPENGRQVQVVCGLIEEEDVGAEEQRAREGRSHAPAAGKFGHRPVELLLGEAHGEENLACAVVHDVHIECLERVGGGLVGVLEVYGQGIGVRVELVGWSALQVCVPALE